MATKKTNKRKRDPEIHVNAKIDRMIEREDATVKAYASVNIGGAFVIKDIAVVDGQKGNVRSDALSLLQDRQRRNQVFGHCLRPHR